MEPKHAVRAARALKIYCPIDRSAWDLLLSGQAPAIEADSALAQIVAIVRSDNPLGDFGIYRSVVALAPGVELFTPQAAARPTLGQAGSDAESPTAILTIYIPMDAPDAAVSRAIDAIVDVHPWEVPVIEITETFLVVRAGTSDLGPL